jgi:hypothetical protein
MITKAWNNGVYYYKLSRFEKAEQWIAFTIKLTNIFQELDHQSTLFTSMSDVITIVADGYNQILQRIHSISNMATQK